MPATLASLLADVYESTRRPDLVSMSTLAVQNATLKLHHLDYFQRDLLEMSIAFVSSEYIQALEYGAVIPRWRALSYLYRMDPATGDNIAPPIEIIQPQAALDSYDQTRLNVVYLSGAYLKIRTAEPQQYFVLGAYVSPDVTNAGYSSWVANTVPHAIIQEACRVIFKNIGKDDEAAQLRELTMESQMEVRRMGVQLRGY